MGLHRSWDPWGIAGVGATATLTFGDELGWGGRRDGAGRDRTTETSARSRRTRGDATRPRWSSLHAQAPSGSEGCDREPFEALALRACPDGTPCLRPRWSSRGTGHERPAVIRREQRGPIEARVRRSAVRPGGPGAEIQGEHGTPGRAGRRTKVRQVSRLRRRKREVGTRRMEMGKRVSDVDGIHGPLRAGKRPGQSGGPPWAKGVGFGPRLHTQASPTTKGSDVTDATGY